MSDLYAYHHLNDFPLSLLLSSFRLVIYRVMNSPSRVPLPLLKVKCSQPDWNQRAWGTLGMPLGDVRLVDAARGSTTEGPCQALGFPHTHTKKDAGQQDARLQAEREHCQHTSNSPEM